MADHLNHDHHSAHTHHSRQNADLTMNISQHDANFNAGLGSTSGHGHSMSFHFGVSEVILFSFWETHSAATLFASCVGIFIVSFLYEGLKYFREYLFWKSYNNNVQYSSVELSANKNTGRSEQIATMVGEVITKQPLTIFSRMHMLQTGLHIIQLTISYLIMLIFMTFNVYLCFSVVLGAGMGYFMFGWKKPVVVDVTEHCH